MKKWIIGLIVAGVVLGGGSTLAFTQVQAQSTNTPTATSNQTPQSSTTATGLTDTQKQQLKDLAQKQQDRTKALTGTLTQAIQQLKDALVTDPTDQAKLSQAQSQIISLMDQVAQSRTDYALQAKEIVGPDMIGKLGPLGGKQGRPGCNGQLNDRLNQLQGRVNQLEQRMNKLDGQTITPSDMPRTEQFGGPLGTPPDMPNIAPNLSNLKDKLGLTNLTDAQLSRLSDLYTSTASTVKGLEQQMRTAEQDLQHAILANPTDQAKLNQVQSTLSALRSQILQTAINAALQAKQIVGSDNFSKIVNLFSHFGFGFGMEMNRPFGFDEGNAPGPERGHGKGFFFGQGKNSF
jgi:Spy/CpxP family protein refolding chaperone